MDERLKSELRRIMRLHVEQRFEGLRADLGSMIEVFANDHGLDPLVATYLWSLQLGTTLSLEIDPVELIRIAQECACSEGDAELLTVQASGHG